MQGFIGYSGFLENNNLFSSFHLGLRKGILAACLSKRLNGHTETTVSVSKQLTTDFSLESHFSSTL
jgi:hypothetical protein